ncbi:hypothetical protein [Thalassolituus pacificus]|uniref:Uncharacterized protein n=1 Tax=Thalassolituus pacificus TaxID=2975440 RepID=A0A9X2WIA9_9GAMM|nr:hypothetical protein [Thalassolituus pacificus]MCT7360870.1 hypothetical protein [Thalassolituus pacificus]
MENKPTGQMTIATGFKYYGIALCVFLLSIGLVYIFNYEAIKLIAAAIYISCGVFLNRTILRNLIEFHPVYSTLDNVFRYKWNMVVIWPIGYLFLLSKLGVNKLI